MKSNEQGVRGNADNVGGEFGLHFRRASTCALAKNIMTLEQLKMCNGYTVQVTLDGVEALATIEIDLSGSPQLAWPLSSEWEAPFLLSLTEEDASLFRMNGNDNLYSSIRLSTLNGRCRL